VLPVIEVGAQTFQNCFAERFRILVAAIDHHGHLMALRFLKRDGIAEFGRHSVMRRRV